MVVGGRKKSEEGRTGSEEQSEQPETARKGVRMVSGAAKMREETNR
jgi:hypothetical protein